jgi:hypothetical protein
MQMPELHEVDRMILRDPLTLIIVVLALVLGALIFTVSVPCPKGNAQPCLTKEVTP